MGALCRQVIEDIRASDGREVDSESTQMAGDLLARRHCGATQGSHFPDVNSEPVSADEAEELQAALVELGRRCASLDGLNDVVFALSSSRDPGLAAFLAWALQKSARSLTCANGLLMNALVALENVGEIEPRSRSIDEVEKNLQHARDYLAARGIAVPW